jgi:thioredoxin-like negative regulator of GroEL
MTPLPNQEFFEGLIQKGKDHDPMVVVRFTASWCGPCKNVKTEQLLALSDQIKWYVADIDEEDHLYTLGYCGLQKIPGFMAIKNGEPQPALQCSNTDQIVEWLRKVFEL